MLLTRTQEAQKLVNENPLDQTEKAIAQRLLARIAQNHNVSNEDALIIAQALVIIAKQGTRQDILFY